MTAPRWRTAILLVLGFVALSLGVLYWMATNGYLARPLTSWLSARLGRTVEVDGGLSIEIGRMTRLTATGVRVANVVWGSRPVMLSARRVVLVVETRSLIQETVLIRNLRVEGLDLWLERNASGMNNWTFKFPRHEPSAVIPVVIQSAELPGTRIRYSGAPFQRALEVELGTVEERLEPDGMLALTAHGLANATPLDLQLRAGPLARLVAAKDIEVQAQTQLGQIALGIKARIDSWEAPAHTQVQLSLKAPEAQYFATRLGLKSFGDGPVALEMSIVPAGASKGVQGSVSGQLGGFAVLAQGAGSMSSTIGHSPFIPSSVGSIWQS